MHAYIHTLYCIVLHCTALHCIVLYCIVSIHFYSASCSAHQSEYMIECHSKHVDCAVCTHTRPFWLMVWKHAEHCRGCLCDSYYWLFNRFIRMIPRSVRSASFVCLNKRMHAWYTLGRRRWCMAFCGVDWYVSTAKILYTLAV